MKQVSDFTKDLEFVEDLMYYDGPLISLYKNSNNENFLYWWLDCDTHVHNWMLLKLTQEAVDNLCDNKETCYNTIKNALEHYIVCEIFDENGNQTNLVHSCSFDELEPRGMPEESVYLRAKFNSN